MNTMNKHYDINKSYLKEQERTFDELMALFDQIEAKLHDFLLDKLNASAIESTRFGYTFRKFHYNGFYWVYKIDTINNEWVINRTD